MTRGTNLYYQACECLVEEFVEKYYTCDDGIKSKYYIISGSNKDMCVGPVKIADDFWSIDEIYIALRNNIDKKILMQRNDYAYNEYIEQRRPINLYHYNLGLRPKDTTDAEV